MATTAFVLSDAPISADGVRRAAGRLKGHAVRTPLIENETLNDIAGGRVLMKAEMLQHCGSFKFRGAFNLISQLDDEQKKRGVVAWSSGNHAQGIARAARHLGVPAIIVMPEDAPRLKIDNTRSLGAEIVFYDRYSEDREEIAIAISEERMLTVAPSFDHPHIIEGQGTLALEAIEDAAARGLTLDSFGVCCGGGGLTAGCATILADASPSTHVWIAEPEGFDEAWASIRDGERRRVDITQRTICDAIATPEPGRLTLPIMERLVKDGASLTEGDVARAMIFAFERLKLVVEPGGAVALAAILSGKIDVKGRNTVITLSGGNVDPPLFASLLEKYS